MGLAAARLWLHAEYLSALQTPPIPTKIMPSIARIPAYHHQNRVAEYRSGQGYRLAETSRVLLSIILNMWFSDPATMPKLPIHSAKAVGPAGF